MTTTQQRIIASFDRWAERSYRWLDKRLPWLHRAWEAIRFGLFGWLR